MRKREPAPKSDLESGSFLGAGEAEAVAEFSGQGRGKRVRREDALGATRLERVEAQRCPHCAGRETVGWGRSHGLLRFRCKSCGRTFNGLTKTPMAHLRKKEKWPAHARAMIEGKSPTNSAGDAPSKPGAINLPRQTGSKALSEMGLINS